MLLSPPDSPNVASLSLMEYFLGDVGGPPAGSLHLLPACQKEESSEAGTDDEFGHRSVSLSL